MGRADLHAHSAHDAWGDGNQSVARLFAYVESETDLDLFAITDHDSTDAAREGRELHARGTYRFDFLPGVEITNQSGHLLCYFPGDIFDVPSLRPFWWTVRYVHDRGGICVPAHAVYPPWLKHTLLRHVGNRGYQLDGVEVVNGGIGPRAQTRLDALAASLAGRVARVGNSDAHHESAISSVYTEFPGRSVADYVRALRDKTTIPHRRARVDMPREARAFTRRRSMTRPGWVRNLYRQAIGNQR